MQCQHNTNPHDKNQDDNYAALVQDIITNMKTELVENRSIDISRYVELLKPGKAENILVRKAALDLKITAKEYDAAVRCQRIKSNLGFVPQNAKSFVEHVVKRDKITVSYNGRMEAGTKGTPHDNEEMLNSLQRDIRVEADVLDLGFGDAALNDAADQWFTNARRDRVPAIFAKIEQCNEADGHAVQAALVKLAAACFDTTETPAEFVAAVLLKFVWQVKRKMAREEVTRHLMPVILGMQNTGKSTFVEKLLSPISELAVPTNFGEITDGRNIGLWKNYALILDEMQRADKSDIEAIKNVITAKTLSARVFHSQQTQAFTQNATFIGTANSESLQELIRDPTGTRRFATLRWSEKPDYAMINAFEWTRLWQSVSVGAVDPMIPFEALQRELIEKDRLLTNVEVWIDSLLVNENSFVFATANRTFSAATLFAEFSAWEEINFPARFTRGNQTSFGLDLKRIARTGGPRDVFAKRELRGRKTAYEWTGPNLTDGMAQPWKGVNLPLGVTEISEYLAYKRAKGGAAD